MGQKKGKSEYWTLRLFVIHLKKRGVPLRIYEMVRWEDTLLGLVRKKSVHPSFDIWSSAVLSPKSKFILYKSYAELSVLNVIFLQAPEFSG